MKIVDKYIIKELTNVFLFGVVAFTSIFSGVGIIPGLVREASSYGLGLDVVLQIFFARIPQVMVYTFPMSILLASLQVFGKLSEDSEITAFRASGVSLLRLVLPALLVGLCVSILTLIFNEELVPKSNLYVNYLTTKVKNEYRPVIKKSVNIPQYEHGYLKRTINARQLDNRAMHDVTLLEYEKNSLRRVVFAEKANFIAGKGWEFLDGILYLFDKTDDSLTRIIFEREAITLRINPTEMQVVLENSNPEELSFLQLYEKIQIKISTGEDVSKLVLQLYVKTAIPFACFIFTLLGAPLGLKPQRSSSSVGIGLSLLVVIFYYILLAIGEWLGLINALNPLLAAWLPNIVIGSLGVFLLFRKASY